MAKRTGTVGTKKKERSDETGGAYSADLRAAVRQSSGLARATKKSAGKAAGKSAGKGAQKAAKQSAQKSPQKAAKKGARKSAAGGGGSPRVQEEPKSPMPAQSLEKPGLESELKLKPRYEAPLYRGADKLMDKVALITGGDSGIGRAVAVLFAREGADVSIVYLPEEQSDAEETRGAVEREGRRCLLVPGDVRESSFCRDAVGRTVEEFGRLDILVNNAAFQQSRPSLEEVSEEQWDRTFRTNIYGYFQMAKAALPHMKEGATIINTGSITGLEGSKDLLDYSATKGAIHAFTKSLAQNLVERRIRVNCVAPGPVWTPLNPAEKPPEKVKEFGADQPMGRPAQPEEVAPAYVFFASEADSSYITGEVITLLGGETTAG